MHIEKCKPGEKTIFSIAQVMTKKLSKNNKWAKKGLFGQFFGHYSGYTEYFFFIFPAYIFNMHLLMYILLYLKTTYFWTSEGTLRLKKWLVICQ